VNWIYKNTLGFILNFVQAALDFLGDYINEVFVMMARANTTLQAVINARVFTTAFALSLVVFMALKMYFTTYVLETDGDPDMDPINIFVRLAQVVACICCNGYLFKLFMGFSEAFCNDLSGAAGSIAPTESMGRMVQGMTNVTFGISGFLIFTLIILIGLVVFMIIAIKRGAELSLMSILFPLFAIDLLTTNRERWNNFFTTYIVTFMAYSLQMLCFRIFCSVFAEVYVGGMTDEIALALGWFILMLSAPKWLEKFCYTSGLRNMAGNSVRTASFVLIRPGMFRR